MAILHKKNKALALEYPIEALYKNYLFTVEDEVWVGYRMASQAFPIHDLAFFKEYIEDGEGILSHDAYEFHFINLPVHFDLDHHIDTTIHQLVKGQFADLGKIYFKQAGEILKDEIQINDYQTYLFVKLTPNPKPSNPKEYIQIAGYALEMIVKQLTGQRKSRQVLLGIHQKEEKMLYDDFLNYKKMERLTRDEIEKILYYAFHRTDHLPTRKLLPEEINEGIVTPHKGYITVEQLDKTHYLCFMPIVSMPDTMYGSAFIQNLQDSLPFAIETHQLVKFEPEERDKNKVFKMRKRLFEQSIDQSKAVGLTDDDEVILFGEERLRELRNQLKNGMKRLCRSHTIFVLAADNLETLENNVKDLQFVLKDTDYKVYRPIADQLTLFNLCMIGNKNQFRSYEQVATTGYVADLGFDLHKEVGNKYGMPLGRVITSKKFKTVSQALALSSKIVWFFPNLTKRAIEGAMHTNGNTLIIGPPGMGKSVLVKYVFLWLTFLGQKILYIDPKNETERFFMKALEKYKHLPEFQALYERIHFVSISDEEQYRGMLDPLMILPKEQAIQTARSVLEAFGEVNRDPRTATTKKTLILECINEVMTSQGKRHLSRVIELIQKKDAELAKLISGYRVGMGKVLIGNDYSKAIAFNNMVTVLGTQGLQLPTQEEIEAKRINNEQVAGMAIMEVLMKLTYIFSTNKEEDAAIIFDEAKGWEDTAQGRFIIDDSLRKGRANGTDIYLVTQAFMDYDREDKKELISYKFAFRPNQLEAQKKVLHFFGMQPNQANIDMMERLVAGTCLFQDHLGRNQPIAIDVLFDSWMEAIKSTNQEDGAIKAALELEKVR